MRLNVIASCARAALGVVGDGSLTECRTFQQHALVKAKVTFFPQIFAARLKLYITSRQKGGLTVKYFPQVLRYAFE